LVVAGLELQLVPVTEMLVVILYLQQLPLPEVVMVLVLD
jgi:hypothetical protein